MAHPFFNVYSIIKDVPSFWIMQAFFMPFLVFSFYGQKHYAWVASLIIELISEMIYNNDANVKRKIIQNNFDVCRISWAFTKSQQFLVWILLIDSD